MDLLIKSTEYAIKCHQDTSHLYDNRPYEYHLGLVQYFGLKFSHLIPEEDRLLVLCACWCHDVIEDTRQTYNDVKNATSKEVAEIVYALTNEKGKNRKERANEKYYQGIRDTKYATFVKLCDRMANIEYSKDTDSKMLELYKKEHPAFRAELSDGTYLEMWEYIDKLLN